MGLRFGGNRGDEAGCVISRAALEYLLRIYRAGDRGSRMSLGVDGRISTEGSPQVNGTGALASALAVAGKDLRIELRTREIVTTAGFFAALVAIMASVSFYSGPAATAKIAPGAIWLSVA